MLDDDYFKDLEFLEPNIIDLGEIDSKDKEKGLKLAKIIILSGAGISSESGISTFRDEDGL